jgi:ABC-type transport system involved in multi-copper enzyme maturation permease subunit
MNALLAKLWLWVWHLLPANPILVRVVHGASRRRRHLWLRFAYLGIITSVVLWLQLASATEKNASLTELAKGASQTFQYAATTQLLLMCFLAPVFTASAITQERDAQTYNILLSTPLTSGQIVLGSLMSRLYFVIMLLLAGLPIFFMTMVYGGVTSRQIFESTALAAATAILTGALAIFIAMVGIGTRRTIFSFYLMIALYLLAFFLFSRLDRTWIAASTPNIAGTRMSWLTPLHPFLALEVALNRVNAPSYAALPEYGRLARYALAFPSTVFVTWTTSLSLVLVLGSMYFVRSGIKTGEPTFFGSLFQKFRRRPAGERTRTPRTVWSNPVAWREARTRASGGRVFRWAIIIGGLATSLAIFVYYVRGDLKPTDVSVWLAGLTIVQFALALIIAANTAATAMTREKESKTVELLLTTPLTSSYILWGKLRGLVSFALPLLAGPVFALLFFAIGDLIRGVSQVTVWIETAVEVGALLIIYTATACVIGLRFSLTSRTNMTAVMSSICVIIIVGGLVTLIGFPLVDASGGEFGAFLAPFTPFTAVWYLVDPPALFNDPTRGYAAGAAAARTAAGIGSVVALGLYAFLVWRGYAALVRGFDMIMRKQSVS